MTSMERAVVAHLHSLRGIVSTEYAAALDFALALVQTRSRLVERSVVVQLLTDRALGTDYIALRAVLLELVSEVEQLDGQLHSEPTGAAKTGGIPRE